jgi:hypothetical protein
MSMPNNAIAALIPNMPFKPTCAASSGPIIKDSANIKPMLAPIKAMPLVRT